MAAKQLLFLNFYVNEVTFHLTPAEVNMNRYNGNPLVDSYKVTILIAYRKQYRTDIPQKDIPFPDTFIMYYVVNKLYMKESGY